MEKRKTCPGCLKKLDQGDLCPSERSFDKCNVQYLQYIRLDNSIWKYSFYIKSHKVIVDCEKRIITIYWNNSFDKLIVPYMEIDFSQLDKYYEKWKTLMLFS